MNIIFIFFVLGFIFENVDSTRPQSVLINVNGDIKPTVLKSIQGLKSNSLTLRGGEVISGRKVR